jgi:hypothetical protein
MWHCLVTQTPGYGLPDPGVAINEVPCLRLISDCPFPDAYRSPRCRRTVGISLVVPLSLFDVERFRDLQTSRRQLT